MLQSAVKPKVHLDVFPDRAALLVQENVILFPWSGSAEHDASSVQGKNLFLYKIMT